LASAATLDALQPMARIEAALTDAAGTVERQV
jgi:hypothetical protein